MNMFYTGLGIARSLGEQGIRVIGLTSHRRIYGNFTRYASVQFCPDSREQPEALLTFLLRLSENLGEPGIIFPTRDDDVIFLDRYRDQLQGRFVLVLADRPALTACLDKWETYRWAVRAGVAAPRCWIVSDPQELIRIAPELRFPCVLKPVSAHHWRRGSNWNRVGSRKAIPIWSPEELRAEYETISHVENRALLQELVPGKDDCLWVAACYIDRNGQFIAGFTARKLIQAPEGFGTGCIVQSVDRPDLLATAAQLLQQVRFSGIAEVEFKQDSATQEDKLIEINPRPWDQHRLGKSRGVDLIHIAYCDCAGLTIPQAREQRTGRKWIGEDVFFWLLLRSLWKRDGSLPSLLRLARGRRVYAIWSIKDPLPLFCYFATRFVTELMATLMQALKARGAARSDNTSANRGLSYQEPLEKVK
jgi:predicted ATP-grasp superfamily ATP-dependent carboligase